MNDGGPAFPVADVSKTQCSGMTLRDWFAGQALAALIAKVPLHDRLGEHGIHAPTVEEIHQVRIDISGSAYDYADAMLRARKGGAP